MKTLVLITMAFWMIEARGIERRQLEPDFELMMVDIERDIAVIQEGLRFGSRKETLEALLLRRETDLRNYPARLLAWQTKAQTLEKENQELKRRLESMGEETVCRVRLFGHEFVGLGTNQDSARARAILLCAETYDYLLECSRARTVCP